MVGRLLAVAGAPEPRWNSEQGRHGVIHAGVPPL